MWRALAPNICMTCISSIASISSRNTTSLLLVLDQLKLLRYHDVYVPEARGFFLDGRPPHATAVLIEKANGIKWSFDSWTVGFGQVLEVMPLER